MIDVCWFLPEVIKVRGRLGFANAASERLARKTASGYSLSHLSLIIQITKYYVHTKAKLPLERRCINRYMCKTSHLSSTAQREGGIRSICIRISSANQKPQTPLIVTNTSKHATCTRPVIHHRNRVPSTQCSTRRYPQSVFSSPPFP